MGKVGLFACIGAAGSTFSCTLQCRAVSALGNNKIKLWQPIGTYNCRSSNLFQYSITIAWACHLDLAVPLGCFMRSVACLNLLNVSCSCSHHCLIVVVVTSIVVLPRRILLHPYFALEWFLQGFDLLLMLSLCCTCLHCACLCCSQSIVARCMESYLCACMPALVAVCDLHFPCSYPSI